MSPPRLPRALLRAAALLGVLMLMFPLTTLGRSLETSPGLPGSVGTTKTFTQETDVAIPSSGTVLSTLAVSGLGAYLWDVDVITEITHTWSADLEIVLTAPNGRSTTITSNNGSSNDNVYNGTLWDDQALTPITDWAFANGVAATPVVPEGTLARMRGVNPNGTWTLTIIDEVGGDSGNLGRWALRITSFSSEPFSTLTQVIDGTDTPIPDNASVTRTMVVSGATQGITDVDLHTAITHTSNTDLDITLTSPQGTTAVITTDNASSHDNVFNGTLWNDQNSNRVTDYVFTNGVTAAVLQPEGALAAFDGEDPNGTWRLRITDDTALDTGTLDSWQLSIKTGAVLTCDGKQATKVRFSSGTVNGTSGNDVIAVRNGTFTINGKGGDDTICAAGGADTISGGDGDDRIFGGKNGDTINGNDGTDQLYGEGGVDTLVGGAGGSDLCVGGTGSDSLASSCETKRQ